MLDLMPDSLSRFLIIVHPYRRKTTQQLPKKRRHPVKRLSSILILALLAVDPQPTGTQEPPPTGDIVVAMEVCWPEFEPAMCAPVTSGVIVTATRGGGLLSRGTRTTLPGYYYYGCEDVDRREVFQFGACVGFGDVPVGQWELHGEFFGGIVGSRNVGEDCDIEFNLNVTVESDEESVGVLRYNTADCKQLLLSFLETKYR